MSIANAGPTVDAPQQVKETGQGFTPPPALLMLFGLMSASVMLCLTGECGIEEVRTLRQGGGELCEDY